MRIFTKLRQMLIDNTDIRLEIEKIKKQLNNQDKNMEVIFQYLDELAEKKNDTMGQPAERKKIGYEIKGGK